jgi:hypothetical protein
VRYPSEIVPEGVDKQFRHPSLAVIDLSIPLFLSPVKVPPFARTIDSLIRLRLLEGQKIRAFLQPVCPFGKDDPRTCRILS